MMQMSSILLYYVLMFYSKKPSFYRVVSLFFQESNPYLHILQKMSNFAASYCSERLFVVIETISFHIFGCQEVSFTQHFWGVISVYNLIKQLNFMNIVSEEIGWWLGANLAVPKLICIE